MLRRKISDTLTEWKNRPHKCLLLKGQRQVGKTFSVREFARSDYENFVEYNLNTDISCRRIFEGDLDVDSLISAMSLFSPDVEIKPKSTLIFIDEIQEFPRAKEALKSFTLDGRYDVIASGSMLGIAHIPPYKIATTKIYQKKKKLFVKRFFKIYVENSFVILFFATIFL